MSEPMVSHDVVAFYLLSQEVAKHVKVVQSGQGADEVFAGYHWYPPMLEPGAAADGGVLAYSRAFFDRPDEAMDEVVAAAHRCPDDASGTFVSGHFARPGASTPIDRALRIDSEVMLVDDPVKRVDNMTMAWGLEARVPFLDHDLVELAAACPPELKVAQGGKGVLKEAARRVIPAEVIDRPKGYFPVPALTHLEGPLFDMVRDALTDPAAKQRGLFEPELRRPPARRPERRAHAAAGQQAVAARAARAVAADPRDRSVTRRANVPTAAPATTHPPPTSGAAARTPRAAPCRTGWSAGGTGTTPSRPPAGRSRPSTWWRRWPATSWSTWAGGGCCSARRSARPRPSWPTSATRPRARRDICLYARDPARAGGQGAAGAVRRPVLHVPVLAAPGDAPARPAARRRRAGARHPRGRRRRQPHLRAVRHGPGAGRRAVGQPAGPPHHLPRGRGRPHRARRSAPWPASTTPSPSTTPRAARSLWTLAVDPASQVPGVGEALVRALAERFHTRGRAYLDLSVMHDNAPGHRPLRQARLRAGAGVRGQAQERHQRAAVRGRARGPRRPQPLRPDHRRRGAAPGRDGRRASTPGRASCGCRTAGAAS